MFELFYTRKEYNIMNQLYVNKKIKKKKTLLEWSLCISKSSKYVTFMGFQWELSYVYKQ